MTKKYFINNVEFEIVNGRCENCYFTRALNDTNLCDIYCSKLQKALNKPCRCEHNEIWKKVIKEKNK